MARLESLQSAPITALASSVLIPGQVQNLLYTVEQGKVLLSWDVVALNSDGSEITDLAGYKVYRKKEASDVYGEAIGTTASDVTTLEDTTMEDGASYVYAVSAYDADANEGVKSADLTAKTIPSIPTGLSSTAAEGSITLTWASVRSELSPDKNENLAGYAIYKSSKEGESPVKLVDVPFAESVEVLEYVDTDVTPGGTYTYTITAYDNSL